MKRYNENLEVLHIRTNVCINNKKETELENSLFVVPQNTKCGTTFYMSKDGVNRKEKYKEVNEREELCKIDKLNKKEKIYYAQNESKNILSQNYGAGLNKALIIVFVCLLVLILGTIGFLIVKNKKEIVNPIENFSGENIGNENISSSENFSGENNINGEMNTSSEINISGENESGEVKKGIENVAFWHEDGSITLELDNLNEEELNKLDGKEIITTMTEEKPKLDDENWKPYKKGEDYEIPYQEDYTENVYVWYKDGNNIELMSNDGIMLMANTFTGTDGIGVTSYSSTYAIGSTVEWVAFRNISIRLYIANTMV